MRRPDSIDAVVGHNIRVQRMARRMSQGALAGKIGISFQQLQKYEKGTNRVGSSRLWRIAKVFNVPLESLFVGLQALPGSGPSPVSLIAKREPLRLVQAFDKIEDHSLRRAIVVVVERIAAVDK
jgi:transcriptional regulator with XRE-family HTH domain